ncbi:hypothetical protein KBD45_00945 [Candidatus Dojkabacteria bacterium]|nr:hypothetical protein [Candidatus Dojkabacteria bacterium]
MNPTLSNNNNIVFEISYERATYIQNTAGVSVANIGSENLFTTVLRNVVRDFRKTKETLIEKYPDLK